jgi:branched-chain amino acid transport system substrate-binding protein
MSGNYIDTTGPGQVAAVEFAVEDFGGSVLGRQIVIKSADDQNKPDLAATNARRWFEVDNVTAIAGGGNSSASMAILNVAKAANRTFLIAGAGNPDFAGKECSPISTQWAYDTFAQATSTGSYLSRDAASDSWFFITADYAFGHALERDASQVVTRAGAKVLGSVRTPLGTPDYASFLLQAQASKAKTIGLAVAGQDLANVIKQAGEFGVGRGGSGQRLAGLTMFSSDLPGLGLSAAQGLVASESFYWDRTDETRAWTKRFMARRPGKIPNMLHAGIYSAVLHYLKAVQAVGGTDALAINARMRSVPINDFNNKDVAIRKDGRVMNPMYVLRVKAPSESKSQFDVQEILATVSPETAFRSIEAAGCKLPA